MNKVRVIFYILKQWLSNVRHNKFMIFASVCVITISLFLLGILFMISENIQYMLDNMSDKPEIIVFCNKDLSDEDCVVIKDKITSDSRVDSVTTISREENFQNLLDYFKDYDSEDLFKGREDVSWVSFTVKLKDSQTASGFVSDMKNVGGVDDVEYSAELVSFFAGAKNITNMGIIIAFVILGLISIVLVYNTIKLTVLSRKKELEIMKYIGASNSYIRGPFYLEGIFIGIIAAILAFIALKYSYAAVGSYIDKHMAIIKFTKVVEFNILQYKIMLEFLLGGIVAAVVGCIFSIQKYLKV